MQLFPWSWTITFLPPLERGQEPVCHCPCPALDWADCSWKDTEEGQLSPASRKVSRTPEPTAGACNMSQRPGGCS